MNTSYANVTLIMRALVIAIIFGQSSAYNSRQRTIGGMIGGVSSQLSDYGNEWMRSRDRPNFDDSIDDDDDIEEDHEIVLTTASTLPLNRSRARKRSPASRLCGNKLVEAIVKMCNGCVKPAGGKPVSAKRSIMSVVKRSTLTEKCCVHRCTFEDMKSFCCE